MLDGSQRGLPTRNVVKTCEQNFLKTDEKHSEDKCEVSTKGNEVVALCLIPVGVWRNSVCPLPVLLSGKKEATSKCLLCSLSFFVYLCCFV